MAISDRIAVMQAGRIVQVGSAHDLYRAPRSVFVAQFIGRVNLLSGAVIRAGGGAVDVRLWGREVRLRADVGAAPGHALSLVLRPESIEVLADAGPPDAGELTLPAIVGARTFLGEKVEYAVEVEGARLLAVTYDPLRRGLFEVGARVRVRCDPASLRPLAAG